MDNRRLLDDVYKDFFGDKTLTNINQKEEQKVDINQIDNMLLEDDSKELLKKIITYINSYKDGVYINFNMLLYGNNKETLDNITDLLKSVSSKYLINNNVSYVSLNELEDIIKLRDYYKSGIVVISNFLGLNNSDINKLIHILKDNSKNKNIVILNDRDDVLKDFIKNDNELENGYFSYHLKEILPDTIYIINDIKNRLNKEIDNIKLEDYINNSFNKSSLDYPTFRDNLVSYIAFNGDVPSLNKDKSIDDILKELNSLIGLDDIKKTIYELIDLISLKKKTYGNVKINDVNLHMVFLGNPGTGKTTVARILANILYDLKYIKYNKLIEVTAKDLVGEYVGQTGPKTSMVINKAMGGVLFIDEAYTLYGKNNSYNEEAVATLIKAMEDYRGDFIVIFAGYTKEMKPFLESNSGIKSRIGYTFNFPNYTSSELLEIFKLFVGKSNFKIDDNALGKVENIFKKHIADDNFGNARYARNLYEKCIIKHASNCKDVNDKERLATILKEDIVEI